MEDRTNQLTVCQLEGSTPYPEALLIQERLRELRQQELIGDTLLLLEHPPTYTKGRRSSEDELPLAPEWYRQQGIQIYDTKRGGKITYHGPGQLVGYPIVRIDDVIKYVRDIEQVVIRALAEEGIQATTRSGLTGIWVDDRKIGSIGIHVSRGVTMHGFAVNVNNDLTPFQWITACGISNVKVTSITQEGSADPHCFRKRIAASFTQQFDRQQHIISRHRLFEICSAGTGNRQPVA